MKYLVVANDIEVSPTASDVEVIRLLEQKVIPSLEKLVKWEEEGIIVGGSFAGRRAGAFILEASSHEEVSKLLTALPFWSIVDWDIIPVQPTQAQADMAHEQLQTLKSIAKA